MTILNFLKGFVTNSSSANFWLEDDEELQEEERNTSAVIEDQSAKEEKDSLKEHNLKENIFIGIGIWLVFSIILLIVLFSRFKNKK